MTDKTYTEDEMNHLLSREVAKQRMGDMLRMIEENKKDVITGMAKLETQIDSVKNMIEKSNNDRIEADNKLRTDLKEDFASKGDLDLLKAKVEGQWGKLAAIAITASACGSAFGALIKMFFKVAL
jgi:hypothetical protein